MPWLSYVDYLEQPGLDFWKETFLLWFSNVCSFLRFEQYCHLVWLFSREGSKANISKTWQRTPKQCKKKTLHVSVFDFGVNCSIKFSSIKNLFHSPQFIFHVNLINPTFVKHFVKWEDFWNSTRIKFLTVSNSHFFFVQFKELTY